jgi:hypothetical protein
MITILLIALWTPDGLRASAYEYAELATCEQVAERFTGNIEADVQILEIWCYEVEQ